MNIEHPTVADHSEAYSANDDDEVIILEIVRLSASLSSKAARVTGRLLIEAANKLERK